MSGCTKIESRYQSAISGVKEKFLSRLRSETMSFSELYDEKNADSLIERKQEIGAWAHKISGVAGSIGFDALSTRAARLDQYVRHSNVVKGSEAAKNDFQPLFNELYEECEKLLEEI